MFLSKFLPSAHAQGEILLPDAEIVGGGGGLFSSFGGGGSGAGLFNSSVIFVWERILLIIGIIALAIIVRAGLSLIFSQDEGKLEKAKREIAVTLGATVAIFFAQRFVEAFYNPGGLFDPETGVEIVHTEVMGLIDWAMVLVPIVSIGVIVFSAVRAVASFGGEDAVTSMRRSIIGVVTGILLLVTSTAIRLTFGLGEIGAPDRPSTTPIIVRVLDIVSDLMLFLSLAAVAVIIYAAVALLVSWGNEERYSQLKNILIRVSIGLVVIFFAYVIAQTALSIMAEGNPGA